MNLMTSYLLNNDINCMILLFYILKDLDADIRRIIYDRLVTYEIIEETIYDWSELIKYELLKTTKKDTTKENLLIDLISKTEYKYIGYLKKQYE